MARKVAKPARDPNIPVLKFKIGDSEYQILIAGPKDFITMASNPKHAWSPNSLVVREYGPYGLKEIEHDLSDAGVWGWIGRLMAGNTIGLEGKPLELLTPTDHEIFEKARAGK